MQFDHEGWQAALATSIADVLCEFRPAAGDEMASFAVDCHPWHGIIALAFLTSPEATADPPLRDPTEMAAWRFYDFQASLAGWRPAVALASAMLAASTGSGEGRREVAQRFLRGCAVAVASDAVRRELARYRLADGFAVTVPHPDTGEEIKS